MGLVAAVEAVHLDRNLIDFFAVVLCLEHCVVHQRVVRPPVVGVLDLRGARGFLEVCVLCAQLGVLCLQHGDLLYSLFRCLGLVGQVHRSKLLFFRFGELLSCVGLLGCPPLFVCSRLSLLLLLCSLAGDTPVGLV